MEEAGREEEWEEYNKEKNGVESKEDGMGGETRRHRGG